MDLSLAENAGLGLMKAQKIIKPLKQIIRKSNDFKEKVIAETF